MAKQRQTDININYKVNTVDIERGNAILNRASQATDQLRSVTNNFGNSAGKTFQSTSKHIEGMEIELQKLRQLIKLTSTEDTARLQKLSAQYKALDAQLKQYNKTLFEQAKASKEAAKASQDLAGQLNSVVSGVRTFISAGIAREILNMSLAAAKLSGTVEGVERAFSRLPNSTLLLRSLQEATHGTVNDLELMQRALMAQNFKIPLENLGTLLEFAAVKAQQTGQNVNHLVDYIISGIGYRSIKRLDDLGFTANRVREALGGVSIQAATMGQMMGAVTTLMNEDLQKTGGYAETAATAVGKLETAWHELGVEVARQSTNSDWIEFLNKSVEAMRVFAAAGFNLNRIPVVLVSEAIAKAAEDQAAAFEKQNSALTENERLLNTDKKLYELAQTIRLYETQNGLAELSISNLQKEIAQLEEKNKSIVGLQKLGTEESRQIKLKKERLDQIIKENSAMEHNKAVLTGVVRILVDYREALKKVNEEVQEAEDRSLVTDPVKLFDFGKSVKVPIDKQMLQQPLVNVVGQLQEAAKQLQIVLPVTVKPMPYKDSEWEKAWEVFREEVFDSALSNTGAIIEAELQRDVEYFNQKIQMARDYYDREILLAGDNQEAKKELRLKEQRELEQLQRKRADAEKKAALASILVSTGIGIMKVWAGDGTFYEKIFRSAIVAGEGAAQYIIAQRARYYAKGEIDIKGPGTKTSDSIPAMLSRGESVMTADETASSKGIFRAVRAKKLNDKVLKEIVSGRTGGASVTNLDVTPIVHGLKELKNSQPDIVKRANMIYEVRKKGENYKQIVRSKSMSV